MIAGSDAVSEVESLAAQLAPLSLPQRLQLAVSIACTGAVRFTTSFGLEDQVITHAIMLNAPEIEIVTIDTGRLFPETHDVWAETEARYRRRIRAVAPDHEQVEIFVAQNGINGFRDSIENRLALLN
jgi:phosphoadenosine phosphosulfate reductase